MRNVLFSDDLSKVTGLLQGIEARVKVVTMFGPLLTVAFVHHIPVLAGVYVLTLVMAMLSSLPIGFFLRRVWLFIPIFTGVIVLPATFSFITHGHIVVPLGHWFGHRVGLTSQGLRSAGLIVIRVATSISLVVLLTLTTPWVELLAALRALRVPRMFVLVTGMAYRYLFHLLDSVTDMYTARKSRMVGRDTEVVAGRAFVGASAGALFGKAHALSEEVYSAMIARGYNGNARTMNRFRLGVRDLVWVAACIATGVVILGWDHAIGR